MKVAIHSGKSSLRFSVIVFADFTRCTVVGVLRIEKDSSTLMSIHDSHYRVTDFLDTSRSPRNCDRWRARSTTYRLPSRGTFLFTVLLRDGELHLTGLLLANWAIVLTIPVQSSSQGIVCFW